MAYSVDETYRDQDMQVVRFTTDHNATSITTTHAYTGLIVQAYITAIGTPNTTADLTLTDERTAMDLLNGQGLNLSSLPKSIVASSLAGGIACRGKLTLTGADIGTSGDGLVLTIYIMRYQ
jgi:hypothetical protein